jgi:hypothetical protein
MLSQFGFPKQLQNEIDASIPPFVSSYSVKIVPSNLSQVQSSTQTLTASSTLQLNGTSSNIIFDIPAGQGNTFIDPRFTTLNFRVNYEVVNTPSAAIITSANLRSSAYAHFDRSYTQSQTGVVLDDVNLVGLVQDTLLQLEVDVAQRDALAAMYGLAYDGATASKNANQGHAIAGVDGTTIAAASSSYYSYSMPLINSLIGKGAKKFFAIGKTGKLQVVLQTAAIIPITFVSSTATTAATFRITIDNISINTQYIDLGPEGMKMLGKTGIQYYDAITYRVSAATLPASTSGSVSLLTGLRGSSVKAIFTRFTEASTLTTAGSVNHIYDSKMPQATSIAYNVNGLLIPPNPVDLIHAPATAFSFVQEANSSFNTYEFKSGLVPSQFFIYLAGGTLATDADKLVSGAGSTTSVLNQSQFLWGYNMEKISQYGILDGQNLNSGNTFLNMTLANANTNTITCYFISKQDIIYVHDFSTGEITARL